MQLTFHHCLNLNGHLIAQISLRFYGMRSSSCFLYRVCLFFFLFLWAKCKRQFSVPFLSCSSRVDHVCVFLFS